MNYRPKCEFSTKMLNPTNLTENINSHELNTKINICLWTATQLEYAVPFFFLLGPSEPVKEETQVICGGTYSFLKRILDHFMVSEFTPKLKIKYFPVF